MGGINGSSSVGAIAGESSGTPYNSYWTGDCDIDIAVGDGTSAGTCARCNLDDVKDVTWYNNADNWYSSYPWHFSMHWLLIDSENNGYPVLKAFYDDNYAPDALWTENEYYADSFAGGNGSASNPYLISTPEQLARLAYVINEPTLNAEYKNCYYRQTRNINMSEHWYDAIGTYTSDTEYYAFEGNYNGGGYTISGVYMTSSPGSYQGIFGYVRSPAIIRNIGLIDSEITGYQYVGGIVGFASSGVTIGNCYNETDITSEYRYTGGIAGGSSGTITNCYNTGNIRGCGNNAGGIVGSGDASYCYNTGSISISSYTTSTGYVSRDDVGGISGSGDVSFSYNTGSVSGMRTVGGIAGHGSANNCYNTGSVSAGSDANSDAGGIVGYQDGDIYNCYNIGSVSGRGSTATTKPDAGGIVGACVDAVYNCVNLGSVTGRNGTKVGAIAGATYYNPSFVTVNGRVSSCYYGGDSPTKAIGENNGSGYASSCTIENAKTESWYTSSSRWHSSYPWDFENTWSIIEGVNDGYPVLEATIRTSITYYKNLGFEETYVDTKTGVAPTFTILDYNLFTGLGYNITHWNTSPTGSGINYYAGDVYAGGANLTLYAQWEPAVYRIELNANDGSGGLSAMYVKYNTGFYSNSTATARLSSLSDSNLPTRAGYTLLGFYTANSTSSTCLISVTTNSSGVRTGTFTDAFTTTYFTGPATLYAQWQANNPAYYDEAGGYWYIENGRMPQTRVTDAATISALNANWSTLEKGSTYAMGPTGDMVAKIYGGKEYCTYNDVYYHVEPIKWRLTSSASQTVGYGTTTATYAIMDTIVYVGRYSVTEIGAGDGYQDVCTDYIKESYLSETYLASDTKSMPTFGTGASLNGASQSFTDTVFVSSREEILAVAGTYQIKFSDFVMDFMTSFKGTVPLYYTRDLGTNYNHIICLTEDGEVVQRQPDQIYNQLGVQFTIKVTEYACVER